MPSPTDILVRRFAGPEFYAAHGGTDQGWVQGMYQEALRRTPNATEVGGWLLALANHRGDRAAIARDFVAAAARE